MLTVIIIIIPSKSSGTAERCPDVTVVTVFLRSLELQRLAAQVLGCSGATTRQSTRDLTRLCPLMLRLIVKTAGQPRYMAFSSGSVGFRPIGAYK